MGRTPTMVRFPELVEPMRAAILSGFNRSVFSRLHQLPLSTTGRLYRAVLGTIPEGTPIPPSAPNHRPKGSYSCAGVTGPVLAKLTEQLANGNFVAGVFARENGISDSTLRRFVRKIQGRSVPSDLGKVLPTCRLDSELKDVTECGRALALGARLAPPGAIPSCSWCRGAQ